MSSCGWRAATRVLVGDDSVGKAGTSPATRWFDHGQIKDLAEAATGVGRKARAIAPVLGQPHPDLERVADAFVTLQSARHLADYDHNYNVTRREARYYVEQAREAIRTARRLRDMEEDSYQRFLKLMVGAVGIAKHR